MPAQDRRPTAGGGTSSTRSRVQIWAAVMAGWYLTSTSPTTLRASTTRPGPARWHPRATRWAGRCWRASSCQARRCRRKGRLPVLRDVDPAHEADTVALQRVLDEVANRGGAARLPAPARVDAY